MAGTGPGQSQVPRASSISPTLAWALSLLSQMHFQGFGLKVGQPGLELTPVLGIGIAKGG